LIGEGDNSHRMPYAKSARQALTLNHWSVQS